VLRYVGKSLEDVVQYGEEKKAEYGCEEESPELFWGAPWMDEGEDEGRCCCQGQEDAGRIVADAYESGSDCDSTADREEDQGPGAVPGRRQGLQHDHLTFRLILRIDLPVFALFPLNPSALWRLFRHYPPIVMIELRLDFSVNI